MPQAKSTTQPCSKVIHNFASHWHTCDMFWHFNIYKPHWHLLTRPVTYVYYTWNSVQGFRLYQVQLESQIQEQHKNVPSKVEHVHKPTVHSCQTDMVNFRQFWFYYLKRLRKYSTKSNIPAFLLTSKHNRAYNTVPTTMRTCEWYIVCFMIAPNATMMTAK